ncbi:hypothetical protein HELRODRAFT_191669 [Helobdella robusta]|uniref:Akirin n=1 Tax=Helobdella robusta TaxID=6412 RepID=T1FT72_HELRO|nr:hypothetical protein HELRODRAFT_191669 [Helobdella robusta]ESO04649.1 hypothetical protein HELRODRAFT_191669 [Helobdella robusta]
MACGATLKRHHEFDALLGSPGGCSPKRTCLNYDIFNSDDSNSQLYNQQSNSQAFIDAAHKLNNERLSAKLHQNSLHLSPSHFSPSSPLSSLKRSSAFNTRTSKINTNGEIDDIDNDDDVEGNAIKKILIDATAATAFSKSPSTFQSTSSLTSPSFIYPSLSSPQTPLSTKCKTEIRQAERLMMSEIAPVNLLNLYRTAQKSVMGNQKNVDELKNKTVSLKTVDFIRNAILEEHETKVKELFDKILADKLSEQYESLVKFNNDQISRKFRMAGCISGYNRNNFLPPPSFGNAYSFNVDSNNSCYNSVDEISEEYFHCSYRCIFGIIQLVVEFLNFKIEKLNYKLNSDLYK